MAAMTRGLISEGPGPINVRCGGWNDWMRFAGANGFMVSLPAKDGPKRLSSSPRDLTLIGLRAFASLSTSTARILPWVARSTSIAQRDGTYPDFTQLLTNARSMRKVRAASA